MIEEQLRCYVDDLSSAIDWLDENTDAQLAYEHQKRGLVVFADMTTTDYVMTKLKFDLVKSFSNLRVRLVCEDK